MAHGTPIINICFDCRQYTLTSRFSPNPKCPNCVRETEQTTEDKIREKYSIGIFYNWDLNFDRWVKISKLKR